MQFSEENSIRRNHYAVFRRKQHKKKISMQLTNKHSTRRNNYAFLRENDVKERVMRVTKNNKPHIK